VIRYCHLVGHTEDRYNQREGIKHLQKPHNVKVQHWLSILDHKNSLIPYLNGTGNRYTDEEMRRVLFCSMPLKWQEEFTSNGNNDVGTSTTQTIVTFMKQQEAKARAKSAANKAKQMTENHGQLKKSSDKRSNDDGNRPGQWKNNKKTKRHHGGDRSGKATSNKTGGDDNEMYTRCTHKHLKKHCLYNPNNPKNILAKLAAKSKKGDNAKPNVDGGHNAHISIDDHDVGLQH
jgi:hypothetical protein